jgi:acetyl-CoA carboxylase carboxyltransferase component
MSFVDPAIAANVVYGSRDADPKEKEDLIRSMVEDASPFGAAGAFHIHDVIDPRHTRTYIAEALEIAGDAVSGGIGEHKLANWPTKF